jgi:hypothetical protein
MMRRLLAAFCAIVALTPAAIAQQSGGTTTYLCVGDQSSGYDYDGQSKAWQSKRFTAPAEKYILRPVQPNSVFYPDTKWTVTALGAGEFDITAYCPNDFMYDRLQCTGVAMVRFSRDTGRFVMFFEGDYLSDKATAGSVASVIGRCSRL